MDISKDPFYKFEFESVEMPGIRITYSNDADKRHRKFYNMLRYLISDYAVGR